MEQEGTESYTADKWKELGNTAFKEKNWTEAKNCFSKAIELNPDNEIFYSNRSAAELYLRSYEGALKDAEKAISLKPEWSRAYQRKGAVLLQTGKYAEAIETLQKGLSLEQPTTTSDAENVASKPNANMQALLSLIASAKKAPKMESVVPRGVLAQVPVAYYSEKPHAINYDAVNNMVDWYTNSNCTALWAPSPAAEITHLTNEECLEFAKNVVARSQFRAIKTIASVKEQSSLDELAAQIKAMRELGVSAVVVTLSMFGKPSDSEDTLKANIETLLSKTGDIPIGIYEGKNHYFRPLSSSLLKFVASLENVWFYIDSCGSAGALTEKNHVLREFGPSFRAYTTSATLIGHCLSIGMDGYCGTGSSFLPKVYSWFFTNHHAKSPSLEEKHLLNGIASFLSISEPTVEYLYPFSLKIFLGIHMKIMNIEAVSRLPQPDVNPSLEENLLRISHLNDAANFVLQSLEYKRASKPADHSVLL